jgi:hypothetical protein
MSQKFLGLLDFAGRTTRPEMGKINSLEAMGARQYSLAGTVTSVSDRGVTVGFKFEGHDYEAFAPFENFQNKRLADESVVGCSLSFFVRHNDEAGLYLDVVSKYSTGSSDDGWDSAAMTATLG